MLDSNAKKIPPPPGIISSLTAGFNVVANKVWIIFLPAALDILLWLGPRLRIEELVARMIAQWQTLVQQGLFTAEQVENATQTWQQISAVLNVWFFARTFPVGVPGILLWTYDSQTPLGAAPTWQMNNELLFFAALFILPFVGIVLGGLYFRLVAGAVMGPMRHMGLVTTLRAWFQATLLGVFWSVVLGVAAVLVSLFLGVAQLIDPGLAFFISILLSLMLFWALVPIFFSLHGVYVYGSNAVVSVVQSLRLLRHTAPTSMLFALVCIVMGWGMYYLWNSAPQDSWAFLIGIFGNAFVMTGITAATFVYYRDTQTWLTVVLELMRSSFNTTKA